MNPFKHNKATLTSGFYFDYKHKCICYLDTEGDEENPYSGPNTTYNRFTGSKGFSENYLPIPQDPRIKSSAVEDLVHLSFLNNYKIKSELDKDFDWIYNDEYVKDYFKTFLVNEELYSLLYIFDSFIKEKELTPEEKNKLKLEKFTLTVSKYRQELEQDGILFIKFS